MFVLEAAALCFKTTENDPLSVCLSVSEEMGEPGNSQLHYESGLLGKEMSADALTWFQG